MVDDPDEFVQSYATEKLENIFDEGKLRLVLRLFSEPHL